ncbi:MAG: hypothetical protein HY673_14300 [Chloroflexi bacterium]|nr:hypothetical protein [Chloroflexota bacterium]
METRELMERTQALNMFWDREVKKILTLKPSAVVSKEEVVSLQEALGAARGGVSQLDINELWRSWTENYSELVKLSTKATKDYSARELEQIYGISQSIK